MKYLLGINLSHDASVALVDMNGCVHSALAEERLSRIKNHAGIPRRSLAKILEGFEDEITHIVIGSNSRLNIQQQLILESQVRNSPSSYEGSSLPMLIPGFRNTTSINPRESLEKLVRSASQVNQQAEFVYINHHDSHLGQALSIASKKPTLLISLDGHGDGESGAVSLSENYNTASLARFSELDSLGDLYSSVTKRYNFKPNNHEGKITGLAAYGEYSRAVSLLLKYVVVKDGFPTINYLKGFKSKFIKRLLPDRISKRFVLSMDNLIDLAEQQTENYADLAFAIQLVLEESVLEITRYWKGYTGVNRLALAGGVFSNVRLNQRLADELEFDSVRVFPNMGDGGISVGGVWSYLSRKTLLTDTDSPFKSIYLSPPPFDRKIYNYKKYAGVSFKHISKETLPTIIAREISAGKMVGLHISNMEFGPRALGNRSIIMDPRVADINEKANKRLRRTEFMPFAPAVLKEFIHDYFDFGNITDLWPFEYMTMTCRVRSEVKSAIPAVVHVDGTARPQIVSFEKSPTFWNIITEFNKITGVPIVINTSFNVHEEPINFSIEDSISALRRDSVDVIFTEDGSFQLNNSSF